MISERDKMLAGNLYNANDPELVALRRRARALCRDLEHLSLEDIVGHRRILSNLFGIDAPDVHVEAPFHCDYGRNVTLGKRAYFNVNCVILDVAPVTIGDDVLFGPGVQIYTATHPIDPVERRSGLESGKPITIGSDVWIGGAAILCPGVTIGARSVIGAGSVVTRDIPEGVIAAGNPCRVLRPI
ncbi:sugar O-acetyltransferase [Isosphaeraceae bacterium EP7]